AAPAATSASATARPMPRVAPVTRATLPSTRRMVLGSIMRPESREGALGPSQRDNARHVRPAHLVLARRPPRDRAPAGAGRRPRRPGGGAPARGRSRPGGPLRRVPPPARPRLAGLLVGFSLLGCRSEGGVDGAHELGEGLHEDVPPAAGPLGPGLGQVPEEQRRAAGRQGLEVALFDEPVGLRGRRRATRARKPCRTGGPRHYAAPVLSVMPETIPKLGSLRKSVPVPMEVPR